VKICRVSQTYPTKQNEGKGLHAYNISNLISYPTLIVTKYYNEEYLCPSEHVKIKKIKYIQYPFPKSKKEFFKYILALFTYIIGQIEFTLKSLMVIYKFNADIIHLQSPHAFLIGIVGKLFGSKIVVTFHGSDLKRVSKNKVFMFFLKKFDGYYYVSHDMKPILEKYFKKEKILFTPSGVDTDFYRDTLMLTERDKILLSVGNIRWQKNFSDLIDAFFIFHKKFPDYKLRIIGKVVEKREYKKIIKKIQFYKLEKKIELVGYKNKYEIRNEMSKAQLFVMSSVTEGMPKVILESFACRLPVLATNVGGCKILINDSGRVVPPSNPELMAQGIIKIINNKDIYNDFLNNIIKNAQIYSWKNNAKKIEKYFEEMM